LTSRRDASRHAASRHFNVARICLRPSATPVPANEIYFKLGLCIERTRDDNNARLLIELMKNALLNQRIEQHGLRETLSWLMTPLNTNELNKRSNESSRQKLRGQDSVDGYVTNLPGTIGELKGLLEATAEELAPDELVHSGAEFSLDRGEGALMSQTVDISYVTSDGVLHLIESASTVSGLEFKLRKGTGVTAAKGSKDKSQSRNNAGSTREGGSTSQDERKGKRKGDMSDDSTSSQLQRYSMLTRHPNELKRRIGGGGPEMPLTIQIAEVQFIYSADSSTDWHKIFSGKAWMVTTILACGACLRIGQVLLDKPTLEKCCELSELLDQLTSKDGVGFPSFVIAKLSELSPEVLLGSVEDVLCQCLELALSKLNRKNAERIRATAEAFSLPKARELLIQRCTQILSEPQPSGETVKKDSEEHGKSS
jgi:hypothetical protein